MAKIRKHTFESNSEKVYNAISKMLILNAAQFDDSYLDCEDVRTVKFSYGEKNPVNVKVTETIPNEYIKYHTKMEKRERFDVEFKLVPVDKGTELQYSTTIITDIKKIETNYYFMSYLYTFKQRRAFKRMCKYLQTEIDNM